MSLVKMFSRKISNLKIELVAKDLYRVNVSLSVYIYINLNLFY